MMITSAVFTTVIPDLHFAYNKRPKSGKLLLRIIPLALEVVQKSVFELCLPHSAYGSGQSVVKYKRWICEAVASIINGK